MATFKFLDFTFCDQSYRLCQSGKTIHIRPKTAQAIEMFINNPQTLITKDELHTALWGNSQHQDYRLFQVISEIRKLAPNKNLIRTQPNHGYYWLAPIDKLAVKKSNKVANYAIAACLAIFGISSTSFLIQEDNAFEPTLPPAFSGYTNAVDAYRSQDYATAQKWLEFSLKENPYSQEAKLLLAEIKFSQQQLAHAKQLAHELVLENESQSYYRGQALSLLSRIATMQHNFEDALDFAIQGKESAEEGFAICSAHMFEQQIAALVSKQQDKPLNSQVHIQIDSKEALSSNAENKIEKSEYAQLCNELKDSVTSKLDCENVEYTAQLISIRQFTA
ncbi:winged helix-turn-helix domain-containing protein [Pseudoalteromonas luteoviolacea]|uniref:OmpR/PhoB-type domain-containing protein n=1 Tax=Pseudoalteromonas luteoviolacea H33 TaxID=1365251 RepID=A0A167A0T1_9GAMM|nr:winged helix-turn-helix domain-containing protein [Pseudoalteromonas luteoviolacea]KZN44870.1 hypothetical protein N476_26060 [Pseudoalteromonas luteoviolacea H33]KZN70080.1 hypothetical protein N477_25930 [Pseudoalteromonas luteoviolacea H33-S]